MKTNYKLQAEESGLITVLEHDKILSKGFTDNESALHSVWVINGKCVTDFYDVVGSEVFLRGV